MPSDRWWRRARQAGKTAGLTSMLEALANEGFDVTVNPVVGGTGIIATRAESGGGVIASGFPASWGAGGSGGGGLFSSTDASGHYDGPPIGSISNPGWEPDTRAFAAHVCLNCGQEDVMEVVLVDVEDQTREVAVKRVCESCTTDRIDVYRFDHYE
jgi:hypothetical protein